MRRLIIVMTAAAFAVAAPAQQALQCVNPDVLNSLVFNAWPELQMVVTRAMPEVTAGFGAPADFKLIGSGVRRQGPSTVVAYKTVLESARAFDNLLAFLAEQGWKRETTPQAQQLPITVAGARPLAASLCRNGQRRNLSVQEIEGVRYANIVGFEPLPPRACDAPDPRQDSMRNPIAAFNAAQASMPQFVFPETVRMAGAPGGGGAMSSNFISTTTRIESPDTAASLAAYLARQLLNQGWRGDAEWSGALSTGSSWARKANDGTTHWGTLEILRFGQGVYEVGFTLATARQ